MKFSEKGLFPKCATAFCILQLILYIPVHLRLTGAFADSNESFAAVRDVFIWILTEFAAFILPLTAALIIFISFAYSGAKHAVPRIFVFSLPYLIGTLPECYLTFLQSFDSLGALWFSILYSVIILVEVTAQMLALFGVMAFLCRFDKTRRFEEKTLLPLRSSEMFGFSSSFAKGLLAATLVQAAIALVQKIADAVSYIISNSGTYRVGEILTMVFSFVFVAAELLLAYILLFKLKDKLIAARLLKDGEEAKVENEEN